MDAVRGWRGEGAILSEHVAQSDVMDVAERAYSTSTAERGPLHDVGIVVIGRNEGDRLRACLQSVAGRTPIVVYVDSGSTDGSVEVAQAFGAEVVGLDGSDGCTAARARNMGFKRLRASMPEVAFIQFIDGDCELKPGWLELARAQMDRWPEAAVVCGRRRERYVEASAYNRLCDIEWDTPVGEALTCGGDAFMRATAFIAVAGFSPELIAGEEPDLCYRLRRQGWKIYRLPMEMTMHDAAMTRFMQWWMRNRRSGYACAQALQRRGHDEPWLVRKVLSNLLWALPPAWLLWPVLWCRVFRKQGALYATHIVAGKLPHLQGQLGFWIDTWRARRSVLIEYK